MSTTHVLSGLCCPLFPAASHPLIAPVPCCNQSPAANRDPLPTIPCCQPYPAFTRTLLPTVPCCHPLLAVTHLLSPGLSAVTQATARWPTSLPLSCCHPFPPNQTTHASAAPVLCCISLQPIPCPTVTPVRRAPVSARYAPSSPGRCGSSAIMPTSGNSPMAHSGIANSVLQQHKVHGAISQQVLT